MSEQKDDRPEGATETDPDPADEQSDRGTGASDLMPARLILGRPGKRAVLVAMVLVLVASTAAVCWLARVERAEDERAAAAQKEVGTNLVRLLSWTPQTVVSDLDEEQGLLTGDFADEYAELVRDTIGPAAEKSGLTAKAQIRASGVISQDGDQIELLYFVNVTVSGKGQRNDTVGSRVKVTAVEKDGRWVIEQYDPI